MTGWIGVSIGDATGVGPEVTLKTLAAEAGTDETRYFIIGDFDLLAATNKKLGINLPLQPFSSKSQSGRFFVYSTFPEKIPADITPGSPIAANAAMAWLKDG